jgi:hypothetical protein
MRSFWVLGRHRRVADDHERNGRQHAHRLEVLLRVEGHLRVQAAVGGQRAGGTHAQRVAVARRGLGHHRQADVAAGAGPVVHHHLLAQLLVQARHQHAHHGVGAAPGREGDDHADGFGGVGRGLRMDGQRGHRAQRECERKAGHRKAAGNNVHGSLLMLLSLIGIKLHSFVNRRISNEI